MLSFSQAVLQLGVLERIVIELEATWVGTRQVSAVNVSSWQTSIAKCSNSDASDTLNQFLR